jgi:hypothetical protein
MGIQRLYLLCLAVFLLAGCSCLPGAKTADLLTEGSGSAKTSSLSEGGKVSDPVAQ